MKIPSFGSINQYYKQSQVKSTPASKGEAKQDRVEISQAAKEMQSGKVDPAREQRIQELQAKIDAGEYR
ncbi:flagellar biosynthesis anti-sigma factor FlgM [Geomicrobium sp. JCM 19039]|uniref:flagellar biosynthesis anti-sigma factor FlgM n=1 Tax=Geomicrobium sp. JCM 19039 TaxID=1460636 RepID=UPI00045F3B7E|nr:flagellar biosynthesis anti-sigma factor FlgM [Geomicrobium sp. JCM 19039]GAK11634.1 hypothetical protein JCM19039_1341 [Geomicrobium sp. JCM 19039]